MSKYKMNKTPFDASIDKALAQSRAVRECERGEGHRYEPHDDVTLDIGEVYKTRECSICGLLDFIGPKDA